MRKAKLNAILIKQSEYGDSSLIYRFFTSEHGQIGVLAKGIRKNQEHLLALCQYELNVFEPKEPGLWLFAEASLLKDYSAFPSTSTWAAAECGMELVSQIIIPQEDIGAVFDLALSFLVYLQKTPVNAILILWRFMLRVTIFSGIGNPFASCCLCEKAFSHYSAYLRSKGGMLCKACSRDMSPNDDLFWLSETSSRIIGLLPEIGNYLTEIKLSPPTINEINSVFEYYWLAHHKHPLKLKSLGLLSQFAI
ncbi:hypothetical protein MASR1M36_14490 [Candidatus Cloacimonadaceae bacterium]